MWKLLAGIILLMFMPGCLVVNSRVTVFHQMQPSIAFSYAMAPYEDQSSSLEHKHYEELVKGELTNLGYTEKQLDQADVVIFITYGIDTGRQITKSYPVFGQTGTSSSHTYGTIQTYGNYGTIQGTTTHNPTYGVVGTKTKNRIEYTKFFQIDILNKNDLMNQNIKKIYEAKVTSSDRNPQLSEVLPLMVKALFEDFPGKSGSTRLVTKSQ